MFNIYTMSNLYYNEEEVDQLYENNPMYERMDYDSLEPGKQYTLAIRKFPTDEYIHTNFTMKTNMTFLRHSLAYPFIASSTQVTNYSFESERKLLFWYAPDPTTRMSIANHPMNRVYRLRETREQMNQSQLEMDPRNPQKPRVVNNPKTSGLIPFYETRLGNEFPDDVIAKIGEYGGKRKNNKKKTKKSKKAKSVRKKSKSLKKNRKTKKTKNN